MVDLRRVILDRHIRSIAIPPLGCGLGGPAWEQVRPVIAGALGDLGVDIRVYEPLALRASPHHRPNGHIFEIGPLMTTVNG